MRKTAVVFAFLSSTSMACADSPADGPGAQLAARFGALESVQDISLAPDGTKLAIVMPNGEGQQIAIIDLANPGMPKPIMGATRQNGSFQWCKWVTSSRLICDVSLTLNQAGGLTGFSRIIAMNADGSQFAKLTRDTSSKSLGILQYGGGVIDWDLANQPGQVLMTQGFVPENSTGSRIYSSKEGLGVDQVDTLTLKHKIVEPPRLDAVEYITDGNGNVRIMGVQSTTHTGYSRGLISYFYRKPGSRDWERLSKLSIDSQNAKGFNPYGVDRATNAVFGFEDYEGRAALYSIALDGTEKKTLVLSHPEVDVDGLIRIGRDNRIVGASYATDRRMADFFDPELKKLTTALAKALPGNPAVLVVDASEGEKKLLVLATSDVNPGMYYLFDKATRRLEELLPVRGQLANVPLAQMKGITYTASDGTKVPAYLTLPIGSTGKGLPAIVMPHGGPSARDEWGFDWLVQYFAARGYAVLQPNYRGSSGYGDGWYKQNGFRSWQTAIGDVNDAGRWLVKEGIANPSKLGIVGWSYGGYAALQSQVLDPDLFKAIVAVAPVTDLERLRQDHLYYSDYELVSAFIGSGPHVREGSPAQNAERFKSPVLMFHGDFDQNVDIGQSRLMNGKLKDAGKAVTLVEFPGLAHALVSPSARAKLLADADAFLRKAMQLPAD